MRRVEITLGLLLLAVSFGPWWTRLDGAESSAWTGPHLSWLAVLLCLAVVAGRSVTQRIIGDRWAAVAVVAALAMTGWGWLAEHAPDVSMPGEGYDRQVRVVLQDQEAAVAMPVGGPFDVA